MADDVKIVLEREQAEVLGRALCYAVAWCRANYPESDTEVDKIEHLRLRLARIMFPDLEIVDGD